MNKEVLIVTKYFVPHKVVDSDSVYQMIVNLKQVEPSLKIHVLTTDSTYKSEVIDKDKYDLSLLSDIKVHKIQSVSPKSASSSSKFIANLKEGYSLIKKAKAIGIHNIISLTNPALIVMWATLYLKNGNFFYWSFDIYPDALVADKILSKNNFLFRLFNKLTYLNRPGVLIALGDCQYNYLSKKFKANIPKIILPCGVHNDKIDNLDDLPEWADSNQIILGYIGNVGRAHSPQFLKNVIQCVKDKKGIKLVLSFYGFYADEITKQIKQVNADNIVVVDFIDKKYLGLIDVNLCSLKQSWNNISVPSKAVSAVCSGSALWFCGPEDSDTWSMFNACSYKSSEDIDEIKSVIEKITKENVTVKKNNAGLIKQNLIETEQLAYRLIIEELN